MTAEVAQKINLNGVELHLSSPLDENPEWVGQQEVMQQLLAAWSCIDPEDLPLHPRLLGRPGVGKTTLACAAARLLDLEIYIVQGTTDTRPEDLVVSPVLAPDGAIRYMASPLVSAMVRGGVAILDEGNRMSERSWASLAPLLDHRRYVESVVAGVRIHAHDDFRFVTTMNEDASTYEIPEYIHSRLMPQIYVDFPDEDEEHRILRAQVPYATTEVLDYVVAFLRLSHERDLRYSVRDGMNMARYAMKVIKRETDGQTGGEAPTAREAVEQAQRLAMSEQDLEDLTDPLET